MERRQHAFSLGLLVALGVALGAPALSLFFWSGDDVFELAMGGLLADGEFAAWWRRSSGSGHTSMRVLPRLLWGLDAAVYGPHAWGYFATNLLLHVACMVAVYGLCFRLTRSIPGALTGGAVFGLLGPTSQVLTFLSTREDSVVTLTAVAMLALWPRARTTWAGRFGTALAYAVICTSKESGVVVPGALVALDLLTLPRREALHPRHVLPRYLPMIAVLGLLGFHWWQQTGLTGASDYALLRGDGGGSRTGILLANLYQGLWNPMADHPGQPLAGVDQALAWALAIVLPAATLLGVVLRGQRVAWGVGIVWILLTLAPPATVLGWGPEQSWGDGRYFHLAAVGLGVVVAAAVAALGARARVAAAGITGLVAVSFAVLVVPLWSLPADYCRDLAEAATASPDDTRDVVLVWPRLDRGAQHILDGGFLRQLVPSLPDRFRVLVEGADRLVIVERGDNPEQDLTHLGPRGFRLDELRPSRDRLVAPGLHERPGPRTGPWFEEVPLPLPPMLRPRGPDRMWSFGDGAHGWGPGPRPEGSVPPGPIDLVDGSGLRLTASGALTWPGNPRPPDALHYPELVSPALAYEAREYCSVEFGLVLPPAPRERGRSPLDVLNFGVFTWTPQAGDRRAAEAIPFWLGSVGGVRTISLDLTNSPTWRRSGTVGRLGLTPSAHPIPVVVESVTLRACTP